MCQRNLVDDFPDELNQKRVQNSGLLLEESDGEGEGMEGGVDGDDLKSDGLHHPRGRIIRKAKRPTKERRLSGRGQGSRGSTTRRWTSALMGPRLILCLKDGCCAASIINDDIVKKMPSCGRKRFVSEGDGGLVKDSTYW